MFREFFKAWWKAILSIGGALVSAVNVVLNLLGVVDRSDIIVGIGILVFIVFGTIQIIQSNLELTRFTRSLPNIRVKKAYNDIRQVLIRQSEDANGMTIGYVRLPDGETHPVGGTMETISGHTLYPLIDPYDRVEEYSFAHIQFENIPKFTSKKSTAKNVRAELLFFNEEENNLFKNLENYEIKGRWAETTQPPDLSPNQVMRDILEIKFRPTQVWELDIAMKHPSEKIGFVFNNDNYAFVEFRRGDLVLGENKYHVKVILRGEGLEPEGIPFDFDLIVNENEELQILERKTDESPEK